MDGRCVPLPGLSIWHERSVALAMVLSVGETLRGSAVLALRVLFVRQVAVNAPAARSRLDRALRLLRQLGLPFSLVPGVLLLAPAAVEAQHGRLDAGHDEDRTRAGWMAITLLIGFLLGTPLMLWFGNSQVCLWPWVAFRLVADLNGLRPSERERLRLHFLGPDARVFG